MDDLQQHIHKLREDFSKGALSEDEAEKDPALQFKIWMQQAVESHVPEVQAMNLATVSADGKPSSRIVYLREFGDHSYCFYTNYQSKKARELEQQPFAALTFFWPQLERQIRIEGTVEKADAKQSDAYFNLRPFESKVGAWASNQSGKLLSRRELENRVETLKLQFDPANIQRPDFWGGLVLKANYYEFWQGRKSRLHDRLAYSLTNSAWTISRLAP